MDNLIKLIRFQVEDNVWNMVEQRVCSYASGMVRARVQLGDKVRVDTWYRITAGVRDQVRARVREISSENRKIITGLGERL